MTQSHLTLGSEKLFKESVLLMACLQIKSEISYNCFTCKHFLVNTIKYI